MPPRVKGAGMFAPFEWMLARRYLRARRKEGFISVIAGFSFLGIMLGVAALIVVMSVMNGFRKELVSKILGVNGHIYVESADRGFGDYTELLERIKKVPGVVHAMPMIEGQVLASSPVGSNGVFVRGLREEDLRKIPLVAGNIKEGSLDDFDADPGVVAGMRLARQLAARVGDKITLTNPRGDPTPFGTKPNIKAYEVRGIFEIGMSQYDLIIAFMPLGEAQAFLARPDEISLIEVFVENPDRLNAVIEDIQKAAAVPVIVTDWRRKDASLVGALQVERNVMFMILTLILVVAAFNIISGMIMLVKDKGRDIAILRTMGATRGAVLRVFLITGASIGVAGTLSGFLLGVLICAFIKPLQRFVSWAAGSEVWDPTIRFLTEIPAEMNNGEVTTIVVMALSLSVLATLYPAWRAAKLDPVEALRYE